MLSNRALAPTRQAACRLHTRAHQHRHAKPRAGPQRKQGERTVFVVYEGFAAVALQRPQVHDQAHICTTTAQLSDLRPGNGLRDLATTARSTRTVTVVEGCRADDSIAGLRGLGSLSIVATLAAGPVAGCCAGASGCRGSSDASVDRGVTSHACGSRCLLGVGSAAYMRLGGSTTSSKFPCAPLRVVPLYVIQNASAMAALAACHGNAS